MSIFNNIKLFGKTSKELNAVLNFLIHKKTIAELKEESVVISSKFENETLLSNDRTELHIQMGLIKAALSSD